MLATQEAHAERITSCSICQRSVRVNPLKSHGCWRDLQNVPMQTLQYSHICKALSPLRRGPRHTIERTWLV